jgi:hypothetical protein
MALTAAAFAIAIAVALYSTPWLRGYALYHGHLAMTGRITGHDSNLPGRASRCVNCHDAGRSSALSARSIAPLTGASLTEPHSRRGGPETVYAESSFCTVLQNGMDPAYVLVNRTMPRYDLSASDCQALWFYVRSR